MNVPDELAAQAREKGLAVEAYVEAVLAREAKARPQAEDRRSVSEALDRISRLRKGNKLDGSNIKNLIHEDHKY